MIRCPRIINTESFYNYYVYDLRLIIEDEAHIITDSECLANLKGKILVITSCSKLKNGEPEKTILPAKDLYAGPLFSKVQRYCTVKNFDFMILSAKYGLIHPDDEILCYEKRLSTSEDIDEIRDKVSREFQKISDKYDQVLVIAGEKYRSALEDVWDDRFITLRAPSYVFMQKIVTDAVIQLTQSRLDTYQME